MFLSPIKLSNTLGDIVQANDAYFMKFLNQNNVCFEIPVYQRNYDWTEENCKQLLEDISLCVETDLKSYFIGSIVHVQDRGPISVTGLNKVVIIDGQQRLTTVSLILLAIAMTDPNKESSEAILNNYLLNPQQKSQGKIKLKPIKGDGQVFSDIINEKKVVLTNSVGRNYHYIKNAFLSGTFDRNKILEGLARLKIVEVSLESGVDNPQLIFESLNSTGLGLSHSDLVRNFILMSLPYEKQNELYEKYWTSIEKNCEFRTEGFIQDFLTIETKVRPTKNSIYKVFKQYAMNVGVDKTEDILDSLLKSSKIFSYIWSEEHPNGKIAKALKSFRSVEVKAATLYLLPLLKDFENDLISEEVVLDAIEICESFVIRRSICELPSSALVKSFGSLHREAKKVGDEWSSNYKNYLMFVLNRKSNKGRFPDDSEVEAAVKNRDFYQFNQVIRNYILDSLENKNQKEKTNIAEGLQNGDLSIEHVMPQTLNNKWKESLGVEFKSVHEDHLNCLGNLTVTAYNSNISNKPFSEKKSSAFDESPFWLNSFIKEQTRWGKEEIVKRANLMTERIFSLWEDLDRSIEYNTDEYEDHVLSDSVDVSYTNPVSIEIDGKLYEATTYREVMSSFINHLYRIDPTKLFDLKNIKSIGRLIVTEDPSNLMSAYEIREGVFIEGSSSATTFVRNMIVVAPYFDISHNSIVITTHKERRKKIEKRKAA